MITDTIVPVNRLRFTCVFAVLMSSPVCAQLVGPGFTGATLWAFGLPDGPASE